MSGAKAAGRIIPRGFWFMRHGETDWNAQSLAQGRVEVALNARGLQQARDAAEKLRGREIASIVHSPLLRAAVSAQIVGETLGLPILLEDELIECAYGDHEGQPMSDWFEAWMAGRYTPAGGESFADLRSRAARAINRCLERPAPVLVVAHGALMRAIRAEMGITAHLRTPNAVPIWCEPPGDDGPWTLTPLE